MMPNYIFYYILFELAYISLFSIIIVFVVTFSISSRFRGRSIFAGHIQPSSVAHDRCNVENTLQQALHGGVFRWLQLSSSDYFLHFAQVLNA